MKTIQLTQGKVALVDDADYEWLNQYKWHAIKDHNTWYAVRGISRNGSYTTISMHRVILGLEPGDKRETDHKNHNGLDNRQDNIRICTHSQNQQNKSLQKNHSSQFKGVRWHKRCNKWQTQIGHKYLGLFTSEVEAAKAYDAAAKEYFGEFALLNFAHSPLKTRGTVVHSARCPATVFERV